MPGSPIGTSTPAPTPQAAEIDSDISELESIATEIESNITSELVDDFDYINSHATEIEYNLTGEVGNLLDSLEDQKEKLQTKIVNGIYASLDSAYGLYNALGFPVPNDDQVKYGIATGDYLGSVLDPDSVPVTPSPPTPDIPDDLLPTPWVQPEFVPPVNPATLPPPPDTGTDPVDPDNPNEQVPCLPVELYQSIQGTCPSVANWPTSGGSGQTAIYLWLDRGPGIANGEPAGFPYCRWRITFSSTSAGGSNNYSYVVRTPVNATPMYNPGANILAGVLNSAAGPPWVEIPCLELIGCVDFNGEPDTPGEPPTEPPTNPGVCAVNNFNCGMPVKMPQLEELPVADTFCDQMAKWIDGHGQKDRMRFADFIQMQWDSKDTDSKVVKALKSVFGSSLPVVPDLLNRFGGWIDKAYDGFQHSLGCDNARLAGPQFVLSWLRLFNQYLPIVPLATMQAQTQIVNSLCQYQIPDGSVTNMMYLADVIKEETWRCLHKANGNYVSEQKNVVEAMRTRLDPHNISKLYRQKTINKEFFEMFMRQSGVMNELDREMIHETTRSWPGISDVIRFLVRDVADDNIVKKFGMDDDFDDKWKGKLIDYADAIGVDKELGRYNWRSHWHIPSFTQLKEMMARLRPGRVEKDVEVSKDDVFDALKQDDWLPFWAKRMMEIARPAVTKTEVVKAYRLHTIDAIELKERLLDLGYAEKDADLYVDLEKEYRTRDERKRAGWPTIAALVKQYSQCLLTQDQFKETLKQLAISDEQIAEAIDAANLTYDVELRRVTVQGIMYQYRKGLISEAEANSALSSAGVPAGCVPTLVQRWTAQRQRQPKHVQAASLCKMRKYGIITPEEQSSALVRGGWDTLDAIRITEVCTMQLTEQQAKDALRAAEKAKREYERQRREEIKRRKQELCGPPPCPKNTPGGQEDPPIVPPLS